MASFLFLVHTDGGLSPVRPTEGDSATGSSEILLSDEMSPAGSDVWAHPERYEANDGIVTMRPYLSVSSSSPSQPDGFTPVVYTLTVTFVEGTAPATVSVEVAGTTLTPSVSNGVATQQLVFHPCLATSNLDVTVSSPGYVSSSFQVHKGSAGSAPQQVLLASPPTVAPVTKAQVRQWLFGWGPNTDPVLGTLTDMLHESYFSTCVLFDVVMNKLLPALQNAAYTPVTLSADEQHALSDIQASLLPNLGQTLTSIYPAAGSRDGIYSRVVNWAPSQKQAIQAYLQTVSQIPNLV